MRTSTLTDFNFIGKGEKTMDERDFTQENTYGATNSTDNNVTSSVKNNITAVKDKVAEQATDLKEKLSAQASTLGSQLSQKIDTARGKTSAGLRTTSQRIQNLAMYVEEHDAKDMSDAVVSTSRELIRKHPGKSILVGLLAGILVGRIFSIGQNR
jgi:ElaB/YqjD/DUF883 family membrane-anchored ribosome-binding protein